MTRIVDNLTCVADGTGGQAGGAADIGHIGVHRRSGHGIVDLARDDGHVRGIGIGFEAVAQRHALHHRIAADIADIGVDRGGGIRGRALLIGVDGGQSGICGDAGPVAQRLTADGRAAPDIGDAGVDIAVDG